MRRLSLFLFACCLCLSAAAIAGGGKGPAPQPLVGGDGIRSADGASRFVTLTTGRDSLVEVVRVRDGRVLRWNAVPGFWGIPAVTQTGDTGGLSHDGKHLVLAGPLAPTTDQTSRFTVVDTKRLRVVKRIELRGAFAFDALSPDMKTLFVVQWLDFENALSYQVRAVSLVTGRLLPGVIVDRDEPGPMAGLPLKRATEPSGRWVYTLYAAGEGAHPFVHALDTRTRTAMCIDLPHWHDRSGKLWRTTLRAPGTTVVLRDGRGRVLATIKDQKLVSAVKTL
jgi:hypothetical protein